MMSVPLKVSPQQIQEAPRKDYGKDPRLERLRRFFKKKNCPAHAFSETFLEAADLYSLDWRLLPSISFIESTGGKAFRNNNWFGWGIGPEKFPSVVAGIHWVGYRLGHSVLYKGKSLDTILKTYNPRVEYARKVKMVMQQIAPTA
jgi:hypothetical protein